MRSWFASGHSSGKTIYHCFIFKEDDCPVLRRQFSSAHFFEKTIVHCLIFREDNCPLLRRQLYSAQFMVKVIVFREDNHPVLHLQRRQSASASYFEKTIVPVIKGVTLILCYVLLCCLILSAKSDVSMSKILCSVMLCYDLLCWLILWAKSYALNE